MCGDLGMSVAEAYAGAIIRKPMSWEEYLELPEKPKAEWVDGVAFIMSPARKEHISIASRLERLLWDSLDNVDIYREVAYKVLNRSRIPDVTVVEQNQQDEPEFVTIPPLIVLEVLSRSTRKTDLFVKSEEYLAGGAHQYWIADPEGWLMVRENTPDGWKLVTNIDKFNPVAQVAVKGHGTVTLNYVEIFGDPPKKTSSDFA